MTSDSSPNPVKTTLVTVARAALASSLDEFLVIGGHAVIVYGIPRFTQDIDFLIPADRNLDWRAFLETQEYRFGHGTPGFEQFFPASPGAPRIDLMLVDLPTWDKLRQAAERHPFGDELHLWLPAPKHLIALKLSAATSSTRIRPGRDWEDVTALVQCCNLDPDDAELKALIQRYGGDEAWHRIVKSLEPPSSTD